MSKLPSILFKNKFRRLAVPLLIFALVAQVVFPLWQPKAAAAGSLAFGMVRFDRMKTSTATTGTVCAKTSATVQTEAAVGVTFPTGYTVSTTITNWAVSTATTTSWPKDPTDGTTSATAWPGITQPTAGEVASQTAVFASSDLTASTWYCFNWTNSAALSIKSSATNDNAGNITTCSANSTQCDGIAGTTANLDTSSWATSSVSNDQIAVTATVNATFTFILSSNTAALGVLSSGGASAATALNATVSTNAQRGWNIWGADPAGTPGLTSVTAAKTIAYVPAAGSAAAALTTGSEGYNLGAGTQTGTCNGSTTIDPNFASSGTSYKGGGLDNTMRSLAVGNGTASTCAVPLTVNAEIAASTPAASDYAGTITVVAAGRF